MTAARKTAALIFAGCATMTLLGCVRPPAAASPPHPVTSNVPALAVAEVPEASDGQTVTSKVTKVTVYSDRARVTRQATVKLPTDPTVFAFRKLPGWVDDGSVRVAASEGRIVDVRVERNFLARATDATVQKAKAKDQALKEKLDSLDDELSVLDAQKSQIEGIRAFSLEKINKDALLGTVKVASYAEVLAFIGNSLRALAKARRLVQRQRDQIAPDYQASQRSLTEMASLMKLEETTVLVTLQSSRATPSTLELTYMLPGATWEPMHDLRASTSNAKSAEVISFAVVTQTSGEDWRNIELSFSTQSSTESVRIPELEALTLGETQTATRVETSKVSSFLRAQDAFQRQSQLWNKVHQKNASETTNFDRVFQSKLEYLQVVQNKTVQLFEMLQKRGTTAHFRAIAAPSVRGDGHPVRMLIGHGTLAATQKIVAVPEQSLNAARTLQMTNTSGQALLPGKVALYQDGAFIGVTELDFIAQNEPFSLFLSVADHLKLQRRLDKKQSALVSKKRSKMRAVFVVTVENLSSQETTLTVADRIPVSENKDIRIDEVKITDGVRPDSRGIVRWALSLKPGEQRQLRVAYQVEYPSELIVETRRRQSVAPPRSAKKAYASPANPSRDIGEQLMDLEQQLR